MPAYRWQLDCRHSRCRSVGFSPSPLQSYSGPTSLSGFPRSAQSRGLYYTWVVNKFVSRVMFQTGGGGRAAVASSSLKNEILEIQPLNFDSTALYVCVALVRALRLSLPLNRETSKVHPFRGTGRHISYISYNYWRNRNVALRFVLISGGGFLSPSPPQQPGIYFAWRNGGPRARPLQFPVNRSLYARETRNHDLFSSSNPRNSFTSFEKKILVTHET